MRKISAFLAGLFCLWLMLPFCLHTEALSGNSLTLHYATNDAFPLADAAFSLYRIAEPDGKQGYTLTEEFSRYQVDLSELDWNEAGRLTMLAMTLSAYAQRDQLPPLQRKYTDTKGDLLFDSLEEGLYLVSGDILPVHIGEEDWNFIPEPLLLPLPYPDIDGTAISDMEIDVKYDRYGVSSSNNRIDLAVTKVWKGDTPPESVTAQLMRNGIVIDSVILNEKNHWHYVWKNLEYGYHWQVLEEIVPKFYTVLIHQEGNVFTITNTENGTKHAGDDPPTTDSPPETDYPPHYTDIPSVTDIVTEEPETTTTNRTPHTGDSSMTDISSDTTTSSDTTNTSTSTVYTTTSSGSTGTSTGNSNHTSDSSDSSNTSHHSSNSDSHSSGNASTIDKLPQTGQLWWPVPILAGAGMMMIGTGLLILRQKD